MPLLASCIMVAWDFSMDPIWATVLHGWIGEERKFTGKQAKCFGFMSAVPLKLLPMISYC